MGLEKTNAGKKFVTIVGDKPQLRVATTESNPAAIKREYENPKTKEKGVKYELGYDRLSGHINYIGVYQSDFGKQLHLTLDDVTLSTQLDFAYAISLMKKLPNVNLKQSITVVPYNFEVDGKQKKGITIYQNEEKIPDFFYDGENKEAINGYPVPQGDTSKFDSDDWKEFYIKCKKFLQNYIETNIAPKVEPSETFQTASFNNEMPTIQIPAEKEEEINIEDIPF